MVQTKKFLVEIGNFIICAKTICTENEVKYVFVLDTQFVSSKELTYEEIVIAKNVIELLNNNKKLAISRLKKWTAEEYLKDQEDRKKRSEEMLEALKTAMMQSLFSLKEEICYMDKNIIDDKLIGNEDNIVFTQMKKIM